MYLIKQIRLIIIIVIIIIIIIITITITIKAIITIISILADSY